MKHGHKKIATLNAYTTDLFRTTTGKATLLIAGLCFLTLAHFFLMPKILGKNINQLRHSIAVVQTAVSDVPQLQTNMSTAALEDYQENLQKQSNIISRTHFSVPAPWLLSIQTFHKESGWSDASKARTDLLTVVDHQRALFSATNKLLNYSPEEDFKLTQTDSPDFNERLQRLRTGIGQTYSSVDTLGQDSDQQFSSLIKMIEQLQQQAQTIKTKEDIASFQSNLKQSRQSILINRQEYWQQNTEHPLKVLSDANRQLTDTLERLDYQ